MAPIGCLAIRKNEGPAVAREALAQLAIFLVQSNGHDRQRLWSGGRFGRYGFLR
jgi:hypothetical protein